MKQLNFIRRGKLTFVEVPEPRIQGPGEAIVKPLYVGRCDLDFAVIYGGTPLAGPIALGHEHVGEIVEVGSAVSDLKKGDVVMVPYHISCGTCSRCSKGLPAFCTSVKHGSGYGLGRDWGDWGGALQDLVRVPYASAMLRKLPDGVKPEQAFCVSDNLADAYRCVAPHIKEGVRSILILGGVGSCALYATSVALALGAMPVFIDTDESRLQLAKDLGANTIQAPHTESPGQFDLVVDYSSTQTGLMSAIKSVEPGGTCVCGGIHFKDDVQIPYWHMFNTGVTLKISRAHALNYSKDLFDLIAAGKIKPEKMTTRVVDWADAAEGYKERATKLVVKF